jgi:hypothetical protein
MRDLQINDGFFPLDSSLKHQNGEFCIFRQAICHYEASCST